MKYNNSLLVQSNNIWKRYLAFIKTLQTQAHYITLIKLDKIKTPSKSQTTLIHIHSLQEVLN